MTTNADLIRHVRRLADLRLLNHGDRIVLLNTADALEAAEAELEGLREIATSGPSTASGPSPLSHSVCPDPDPSWRHYRACHNSKGWPADLLEAVRIVNSDYATAEEAEAARATLRRYGLLQAAPREDAP